jgi:hypothetical protein
LTATALLAFVGDIHRFPSGRHLASYLGLTPREYSSGSRRRLGRISKRGDAYVRMLLIHGARSVLMHSKKLAQPDRPVVALIGDGSAMYTIQSLWSAAHDSIAVVFVIFNNQSYRILKQRTQALKGFSAEDNHYVAMDLVKPGLDYVGLARAQGVPGEIVEKTADVATALHRGLASGGPYLLDVRIDGNLRG